MANKENIQKVIDAIENEKNHFSMSYWDSCLSVSQKDERYVPNTCGTPSCIGGWAESIMLKESGEENVSELPNDSDKTAKWLGLTIEQGDDLFFCKEFIAYNGVFIVPMKSSRAQAVAYLKHIIETGEVGWENFYNKGVK